MSESELFEQTVKPVAYWKYNGHRLEDDTTDLNNSLQSNITAFVDSNYPLALSIAKNDPHINLKKLNKESPQCDRDIILSNSLIHANRIEIVHDADKPKLNNHNNRLVPDSEIDNRWQEAYDANGWGSLVFAK